ncbi:hypothetical protein A3Q56_08059, partial [Intoshia linei]
MIVLSIRKTPTEKHKYSPALMVFNKELSLPIHDLNPYLNQYYTNKKAKDNQRIKFYYDKKSIKKPSYHTQNYENNNPISNKNMPYFRPREKFKLPHRTALEHRFPSTDSFTSPLTCMNVLII